MPRTYRRRPVPIPWRRLPYVEGSAYTKGWDAQWFDLQRDRQVVACVRVSYARAGTWSVFASLYVAGPLEKLDHTYLDHLYVNPRAASLAGLRRLRAWGFRPPRR
jgi:hypothetical protein